MTVAAGGAPAIRQAGIGLVLIAIVTLFHTDLGEAISADRGLTVIGTVI